MEEHTVSGGGLILRIFPKFMYISEFYWTETASRSRDLSGLNMISLSLTAYDPMRVSVNGAMPSIC